MDARILLELGERTATERPIDSAGSLVDLDAPVGYALPDVVDGVTGRARVFDVGLDNALAAVDTTPGLTLLTRDVTVQALLMWDFVAQHGQAEPGTLIARGKGTSAAEYMCFGLELRVVNQVQLAGEIRWLWHDLAGALKTQIGGHFRASLEDDVIMLTATRRWVSTTEVELRYYLGDELLADVTSADGAIGGGTTGTTSIGRRYTGAAYERPFAGVLEQLRVLPRALCQEEIRSTWERMTVWQPRARQLVRELHPPGFPMASSPGSRIQRENALWGDSLGYALAQAEDLRRNAFPHRSYGPVLEEWERATRQAPKPRASIELRRARVAGRLAQRRGVSIPGIGDALKWFVDTDVSNLEVLAFDQTIREDWSNGIREERWYPFPQHPLGQIVMDGGEVLISVEDGVAASAAPPLWNMLLTSIGGQGRGVHVLAKVTPTLLATNGQSGIVLGDRVNHNYIVLLLQDALGANGPKLKAEVWHNGVLSSTEFSIDLDTDQDPIWLHLYNDESTGSGDDYVAGHSTVGPLGPFVYQDGFEGSPDMRWAGLVTKVAGAEAGEQYSHFGDVAIRAPNGDRSFHLYVYRNPALPGSPDLIGGNGALKEIAHAWTHAHLITSKSVLCDDPACLCDGGPMGAL
jgi:hypothetical protein